jgi:hypothetical protein
MISMSSKKETSTGSEKIKVYDIKEIEIKSLLDAKESYNKIIAECGQEAFDLISEAFHTAYDKKDNVSFYLEKNQADISLHSRKKYQDGFNCARVTDSSNNIKYHLSLIPDNSESFFVFSSNFHGLKIEENEKTIKSRLEKFFTCIFEDIHVSEKDIEKLKNMQIGQLVECITAFKVQAKLSVSVIKCTASNNILSIPFIIAVSLILILILCILFSFLTGIVKFNSKVQGIKEDLIV